MPQMQRAICDTIFQLRNTTPLVMLYSLNPFFPFIIINNSLALLIFQTTLVTNTLYFHSCPLTPILGSGPTLQSTPSSLGPIPFSSHITPPEPTPLHHLSPLILLLLSYKQSLLMIHTLHLPLSLLHYL
jgi:hypothetical protein